MNKFAGKKVGVFLGAIAIITVIIVGTVVFIYFQKTKYIQVSDVKLGYSYSLVSQTAVTFTVRNLHSAYILTFGVDIDEKHYGPFPLLPQLPPGQTGEYTCPIQGLVIASSKTYSIKLTFTMADGKYETYSCSYTTPQFKGQAQITDVSLTLGPFLSVFSVTIENTGNLPITKATYKVANKYEGAFWIGEFSPLMPGKTANTGWTGLSALLFQVGNTYSVTIDITYIDGSTSTLSTTVTATRAS